MITRREPETPRATGEDAGAAPGARRPARRGRGDRPVTFTHILVPVDLSDRNRRPLAIAAGLAEEAGARVTILHVVEQIARIPVAELRVFYRRLAKASATRLEQAARPMLRRKLRVASVIRLGDPPLEILRFARLRRVDLIVMASHRIRPGRRSARIGTTSYKVALACQCPVLLVK